MNLQLTGGAARCVTTAPGGLLPRLFTLTALPTREVAAFILCHLNPTVSHSFPLRNVMLCVARTFLSVGCQHLHERQTVLLQFGFSAAKLQVNFHNRLKTTVFFIKNALMSEVRG